MIASGSTKEELREESIVIELDVIELMDHSADLAEAVLSCTGAMDHRRGGSS